MSQMQTAPTGLSRRGAIASVLAATVATMPVMACATTNEDSAALALCAAFWRVHGRIRAMDTDPELPYGSPEQKRFEAELAKLCWQEADILGQLANTPARTTAGQQGKASILRAILPTAFADFDLGMECEEIRLVMSLLDDLAGGLAA
ncbi:hypothetical protein [Acetobacter ghanensis]|uniref:Uncharacterized protein n=1 Tax=Acetobacter ghanensis TaxID=431306 RepID=A0A0U5F1N6_9PROT|nr:hypothetical protein [Acetobacter ghanensis]NHO39964.1 hypothetical protein [Acetobacter ghanensis]GBQ48716.1 hypothetical protein AA18895_1407 [Acetobacter ghanensis DSM 18895]CEF53894.1 hypothetical protein predicted by Glimmer/Critica [Acetobacter ghanensis]